MVAHGKQIGAYDLGGAGYTWLHMVALMATYDHIWLHIDALMNAYFMNEEAQSASEADVVSILLHLCRPFMNTYGCIWLHIYAHMDAYGCAHDNHE